jgi:phage tail-like protein
MAPSPVDPFSPALALRFALHIEGEGKHFDNVTACEGLDARYDVYEFSEGGAASGHKLPTGITYSNVKISRAVDHRSADLARWFGTVRQALQRTKASVVAYDANADEVARWDLEGVWPVRYTGPRFTSSGTAAAIETIELAHTGFHGGV